MHKQTLWLMGSGLGWRVCDGIRLKFMNYKSCGRVDGSCSMWHACSSYNMKQISLTCVNCNLHLHECTNYSLIASTKERRWWWGRCKSLISFKLLSPQNITFSTAPPSPCKQTVQDDFTILEFQSIVSIRFVFSMLLIMNSSNIQEVSLTIWTDEIILSKTVFLAVIITLLSLSFLRSHCVLSKRRPAGSVQLRENQTIQSMVFSRWLQARFY